jgi:hypothetical protein
MRAFVTSALSIAVLAVFVACGQRGDTPETAKRVSPPPPPPNLQLPQPDLSPILSSIPANASREQVDHGVESFMAAFSKSRSGDRRRFTDALATLRDQPQLVSSIVAHYQRLPQPDHTQRITTLAILGELRRPDAMPFLQQTVWTQLPNRQPMAEGLTPRDLEEMVIVKAVQGLGYLRTPESDKALLDVMQRHESRGVKIAAISSYMWNHDDTSEAAQALYQILPADLHKFVERPRFHRNMDRNRFNEQLKAWQQKWGTPTQ